ncbi:MAG: hypothetical protein QNL62_04035 [Gammaproteobacteria bacterium]|nr:hypothetical protein [Gammaproteobacteria bacterium]
MNMKSFTEFDLAGAVKKANEKHYYIYLDIDDNDRIQFCLNEDNTDNYFCFDDLFGVFDHLEKVPTPNM